MYRFAIAALLPFALLNTASAELPRPATYVYKKVSDCEIKADVYKAAGNEVRPGILWIHGGALILGSRESIRRRHFEKYLQEGFNIVSIDYRLGPETKLPGIIADLKDAYRWMRKNAKKFHIDPGRIAVVGHSAGGYLTLMSGFVHEPRPRALVAFYGYGDVTADWFAKPEPHYVDNFKAVKKQEALKGIAKHEVSDPTTLDKDTFASRRQLYLYLRQTGLWPKYMTGNDPHKQPGKFTPFCPEKHVSKDYPPTLMLHGTVDTDVPHSQSARMAVLLKKAGVEHELITMPGMGHGFDGQHENDPRVQAAFAKVLQFLQKHTVAR